MANNTTNSRPILAPEQVAELLVTPTLGESIAAQVANVVMTDATASSFRIPSVQSDPSASWVLEGEEIPISEAAFGETIATFSKLAGVTIITNELAEDSSPEASAAIGAGLARDMARKLDAAWFGKLAAPAPAGLGSLKNVSTVAAGPAITNTDPFVEAIAAADVVGAQLTSFVANPADALALAKVKKADGSNEPLMQNDPTAPTQRLVSGLPLFTSPFVATGTIWGIPQSRAYLVIREDAQVEADPSPFFTSDRTAVRGKMRVGFAFPHEIAVVKITIG